MLRSAPTHYRHFLLHTHIYIYDPFIIFMQVTQQVFMADEWARNAHNEVELRPTLVSKLRRLSEPIKKSTQSWLTSWSKWTGPVRVPWPI